MKCIDAQDVVIQGSHNSDKASNLMVVFERCKGGTRAGCKSESDIDDWL